ncbi:MAG: polysaccharide biosynthesis tyrosine autokinase [Leifsonia sp.]|uniref:polysaccharide biosynthesis tyrosine autokinase n=1 Tax=Leifsonia sp. TaxID=1870902 RepID=UPI003F7E2691
MDLHQYLLAIRKRWITIVALILVGAAAGFVVAAQTTPVYRSTASVFISARQGDNTSELLQGSTFAQNVVQSYAALATTESVLKPAMDAVGYKGTYNSFAGKITAETPINTVIINISADDPDPSKAQDIASAVTSSLSDAISAIAPKTSAHQPAITTSVIAAATLPKAPISPNRSLSIMLGAAAGLALGLIYAVMRQLLDTRVRTSEDIQRVAELPILARIPRGRRRTDPLAVLASPGSAEAESYRGLVSNLEFADLDRSIRVVVVTSPSVDDGKSTVSVNLALAMAERVNRVLLVDADLRRPSVANLCQIEGSVGLTTVLVGRASLSEAVQQWGAPNLDVLAAGSIPSNPSQLLSSEAFSSLVRTMAAEYDFVVFDSVPLLTVTDTLPLARLTDGALVTVRYNGTTRHDLEHALESLQRVNAPVLGAVMNFVPAAARSPYTSYVAPAASAPRWPASAARRGNGGRSERGVWGIRTEAKSGDRRGAARTDDGDLSASDLSASDLSATDLSAAGLSASDFSATDRAASDPSARPAPTADAPDAESESERVDADRENTVASGRE